MMLRHLSLLPLLLSASVHPLMAKPAAPTAPTTASTTPTAAENEITVTAQKLDKARASIKTSIGASTYTLDQAAIKNLPGADNLAMQDIILQMPGVSQDQFGQFHVRDEHNGVQYRLNGVIIPESIATFGQMLSPRLVDTMQLVTGTLPAQYGLSTAAILDITTKSGLKSSATVSLYGGSYDTIEPSIALSGGSGATSWFASGDFKHDNLGIDNVNGTYSALHDQTNQGNLFFYVDRILGSNDRIALTGGYTVQHFQIPNPAGPTDQLASLIDANGQKVSVNGLTSYNSANLNETQLQVFGFGALSWLHSAGDFSAQTSLFDRVANLDYHPDLTGELLFNTQAQFASKRDVSFGLQSDSSYRLSAQHTLRAGLLFTNDQAHSWTNTAVFPVNNALAITGGAFLVNDVLDITQRTYSAYIQDEWHITHHLVANYGVRFDENDGLRNERQWSPRTNLVWTPADGTTFHAGYARYFSPAPFELIGGNNFIALANTSGASPQITDTPAYAQRENYGDVGVEQKIAHHWTIGLDSYMRSLTNLVDEGQFGAPIILTPFNYAQGRIRGVELNLNYTKGPLSAYANLAWARAQGTNIVSSQYDFSASDLAYIANHWILLDHDQTWTSSAGASYHWREGVLKGTSLSTDMSFGSGLRETALPPVGAAYTDTPNGAALPDHVAFNLSLGHHFAHGFDAHIDVVNLFDSIYEIRSGTGVGVGAPSFGQRRSIFLGVSKTL